MVNKITKIVVQNDDVTFYFEGSDEPFSVGEFEDSTYTRRALGDIEYNIIDYNSEVDVSNG